MANLTPWLLALVAACGGDPTRIYVAVRGETADADHYQIRVDDTLTTSPAFDELELRLPDDMAGHTIDVEVWGLDLGRQVAFGRTTATPRLHADVTVELVLAATSCGLACELGAVACAGDGLIACEVRPDGCLGWSDVDACPDAAPYCSNGTCAASCSDECAPGTSECDGTSAVRTCGEHDGDGCRDWSAPVACAGACTAGTCEAACDPASCDDPPEDACLDERVLRRYAAGTCGVGGACEYEATDVPCPDACFEGACRSLAIEAGHHHTCALEADGRVRCWGYNGYGATTVPNGRFSAIAAGAYTSCGLRVNGALTCWGRATGHPEGTRLASLSLSSSSSNTDTGCGIKPNGSLLCWGYDGYGAVSGAPAGTFRSVEVGSYGACAIRMDDTVVCWGSSGVAAPTFATTDIAISAYSSHWCAIDQDARIACSSSTPPPPAGRFTEIDAGWGNSCAVTEGADVRCWGNGPGTALTPPAAEYLHVTAGANHSCGRTIDGEILCWGDNMNGQLATP